jgi:cobalt-zinc-cadmium efflux system outer membrane protein
LVIHARAAGLALALAATLACATAPPEPDASTVAQRFGIPERPDAVIGTAIPPGVTLGDGVTVDEAIAIALWNNPDFRLQLTDLGFARADLVEAGMLRNPVLSLLFPVGPKQLEATLRFPIEVLWERPKRVAAANLAVTRVATGLEQFGLNLVADVKTGFIDLALARDRVQLAGEAAAELDEIQRITAARLRAGDISELEAQTPAIDAARARQEVNRARHDVALREQALRARLGLSLDARPLTLVAPPAEQPSCSATPGLVDRALASRPDVRAAELAVEAAAARMGWEGSRVTTVSAVLDANGAGQEGFELGPGVDIGLPLFDSNDAGRARAAAEFQRAGLAYSATRQRVAGELSESLALLAQARESLRSQRDLIVAPLERQLASARRAYDAGDVSQLFVLEMSRRLSEARLRARDLEADIARAVIRTERASGQACDGKGS